MTLRILKTTRFRLSAYAVLVLTCSIVLIGLFLLYSVRQSMLRELEFRVQQELEVLLLDYREDGLSELLHDIRERREAGKTNRLFYFLENQSGKVIFDEVDRIPDVQGWYEIQVAPSVAALVYAMPLVDGYLLAVGASLENIDAVQSSLLKSLFSATFLTLLLGIGSGLLLSQRFLSRIDQISREAERIGSGKLTERLSENGSGDDFDQLAATINRMLDRIEALVRSVKRVSAHVAHELRTPIGHLQHDLESLLEDRAGARDPTVVVTACLRRIDGILEIFTALLRISEVEAGELKSYFEEVSLTMCLEQLFEIYEPVAEANDQALMLRVESNVTCLGDKRLLLQLFSNLIENALQHTGVGATVTLHLESNETQTSVTIADSGRGLSDAALRNALHKLQGKHDDGAGLASNGLGLMLVGAIARLHTASVEVQPRNPGIAVVVTFPISDRTSRHARVSTSSGKEGSPL